MKKTEFQHNATTQRGFDLLNKNLSKKKEFTFPNFEKVFRVECDASRIVIGSMVSKEGRPIAYFREKLNEVK
jgi:hypothetical protein